MMDGKLFLKPLRSNQFRRWSELAVFLCASAAVCAALSFPVYAGGPPEWLVEAAQKPTPPGLPKDTDAVILYADQQTTVNDKGEVETLHRAVIRILRPGGRDFGKIVVWFSPEDPLLSLKGWSIPASGKPYEVGQKEAVESSPFNYDLYSDNRQKVLTIPASDPGNVIGYEWVQRERPYFLQKEWDFQHSIPVLDARFSLDLPAGWEYVTNWRNHAEEKPLSLGAGQYSWQMQNVAGLKSEDSMPGWDAVASSMSVSFYPADSAKPGTTIGRSWSDVSAWHCSLCQSVESDSPQIRAKVSELTAGASSDWEKIQRLAGYVQSQIRYVAIEIGIGGYKPHPSPDVFRSGYGDCKDKAALLVTMLHDAGMDSTIVLVNTERAEIVPQFPTLDFDHAVVAIHLPDSAPSSHLDAEVRQPGQGRLLFFDPTNPAVPIGELPQYLQANFVLMAQPSGGALIELPISPPEASHRTRSGKFSLSAVGNLSGDVTETSTGSLAADSRTRWQSENAAERTKHVENMLGNSFIHFALTSYSLSGDEAVGKDLGLHYSFQTDGFAQYAGGYLVVRPCVIREYASDIMERPEPRRFPVELGGTSVREDDYEILVPSGLVPDDLPDPVNVVEDFAEYHSSITFSSGALHYHRTLITKKLIVPVGELPALKTFYQKVAGDQAASALLRPARAAGNSAGAL
jgi:hypothetical protein